MSKASYVHPKMLSFYDVFPGYNIPYYLRNLAFRIGKGAVSFLPGKRLGTKVLCFNPFTAFCLYVLNQ